MYLIVSMLGLIEIFLSSTAHIEMALGGYYTLTVFSNSYHEFVVFSSLGITKDAKDEKVLWTM